MSKLEDLKSMDCVMVTPAIAANVIGCDPQIIRVAAKTNPGLLGFPVSIIGNRIKIPRLALIKYLEGQNT